MNPISVIVPVLNEEKNIHICLGLALKHPEIEFIFVDGGSRDKTLDILSENERIKIVHSEKGRGVQMNAGAHTASGRILLFLHADVYPPEDVFYEIRKIIDSGAIGGAFRIHTKTGKNPVFDFLVRLSDIRSRYSRKPFGDQGIFCKKEVFDRLGGYREIPLFEDYDFSKRLNREGNIRISKKEMIVSGRRYIQWGLIKSFIVMKSLQIAYRLGVDPQILSKIYQDVR